MCDACERVVCPKWVITHWLRTTGSAFAATFRYCNKSYQASTFVSKLRCMLCKRLILSEDIIH